MGIKDLLRFMKPYTEAVHIEKYRGKRVGIDAYSWLHKGAYSCSMEISLDTDSDAKFKYISYFMHRIDMLRHYKIVPVVVFDGGNVPCKAATEDDRHRKRETNRELAMEKLKEGNVSGATELFQRAISITTSMAHQLIQTLRGNDVEFMVAPYEADAQLAYLSSLAVEKGGIEAVITEDSDLLAYGCPSVIFKMDRYGNGEEILLEKVFNSTNRKPSFQNFNRDLFTGMCVLAGCDFLPSIPGIGIGRAYALVSKYYNIDRESVALFDQGDLMVLSVLKFEKSNQIPEDYLSSFTQAVAVFQHARVYDKITKRIEHIKPLNEELVHALNGELDFLGSDLPPSIATAISEGLLDPITMEAYNCSQTSRRHQPKPKLKQNKESTTTTTATSGSCFAVYTSQRNKEAIISTEVQTQRQVLKERNYSNEATQLAKIVQVTGFPSTAKKASAVLDENSLHILDSSGKKRKHNEVIFDQLTTCNEDSNYKISGYLMQSNENLVKTPDNNPFKKCNQVSSDMSGISMICDDDLMTTPDNNPFKRCNQVSSTISGVSVVTDKNPLMTPDNNLFKMKCSSQITIDLETDTFVELCTTEAETKCNTVSPVLDSQESVNSKLKKTVASKKGKGCGTRLKNSGCKNLSSSRNNKSTILDFFSRS